MKANNHTNTNIPVSTAINSTMQELVSMTKFWIARGEYEQAKKFIHKADEIYNNGDAAVRKIVKAKYMNSFSTLLEINGGDIASLFPQKLMNGHYGQAA
jgi:uncharacterized protein HemY